MSRIELFKSNGLMLRNASNILKYNEISKNFGLVLTQKQALMLANVRADELRYHGRLEFGEGIFGKLIESFCDSPYITQQSYFETL